MGRETRNFRQKGQAGKNNNATRNYPGINRAGYFGKIVNFFKKGGYYTSKKGEV